MGQRVLLADDVSAVRQGVRALLEREGFEVVGEAENGKEAVRLAQALLPDVVILDLSMPELNGLEAAREIQQFCPWTHRILLTVHAEEHHIVTALRAGIRGYVVKAEAPEALAQAIGEVSRGEVFLSPAAHRIAINAYPAQGGSAPGPAVVRGFGDFSPAASELGTAPLTRTSTREIQRERT